jgi:Tfp pilus assembly protein PilN
MNQQINLYQLQFRRQKKLFSAMTMIQVCAIFLFISVSIYSYSYISLQPLEGQLSTLQTNLAELNDELTLLQAQLPGESGSRLLENEITRLSNELSRRQRVADMLSNRIIGNIDGLSGYLEVLARQHVEGAWLTKISVASGGEVLSLEGRTQSSELVPIYLDRLATEPLLDGMAFNVMEMTRPDTPTNFFEFLVSTH